MLSNWASLGVGAFLLFEACSARDAAAAPTLEVRPRFTTVYDTNLARSTKEAAEIRNLRRSDVRFSPGLSVSTGMPIGNQSIFLNADAGYDFHQRNKQLNRFNTLIDGGARLKFSRCRSTLTGNYGRRQSELTDFLDLGSVKNTEVFKSVGLDTSCGGPVGLIPKFGVSNSWSDNSAKLREISDARTLSVKAGVAYARPSFGELSAVAERRRIRYPNRVDLEGLSDGYDLTSLGGTFERNLGSRLRGIVGVYRTSVDSGAGGARFSGLTANARITYRIDDQLQAQFSASRDVAPATLGVGDFIVSSSYRLTADYALTPRLSLNAGAGLESRRTEGLPALIIDQLSSQKRYLGNFKLTFRQSERVSIDTELRHEVRRAVPDLFSYSSTQAILNLRLGL